MKTTLRSVLLTSFVIALAACGDPDTNDPRGYTKAPLETPGWTVEGEEPTAMAELGDPIRIPSMDTLAVDTSVAPAVQPSVPAAQPVAQ
jgi:hypothetical protein